MHPLFTPLLKTPARGASVTCSRGVVGTPIVEGSLEQERRSLSERAS
jgi:hypothetical protein